jgi:hypothetical protein
VVTYKTGSTWTVHYVLNGVTNVVGEFWSASFALHFMFWSLTGAKTYDERYAEISPAT